jgi:hypothetical protein
VWEALLAFSPHGHPDTVVVVQSSNFTTFLSKRENNTLDVVVVSHVLVGVLGDIVFIVPVTPILLHQF